MCTDNLSTIHVPPQRYAVLSSNDPLGPFLFPRLSPPPLSVLQLKFADGSKYAGQFANGMNNGLGVLEFPDKVRISVGQACYCGPCTWAAPFPNQPTTPYFAMFASSTAVVKLSTRTFPHLHPFDCPQIIIPADYPAFASTAAVIHCIQRDAYVACIHFCHAPCVSPAVQSKYSGTFSDGKYDGHGVFTKSDGMKYDGSRPFWPSPDHPASLGRPHWHLHTKHNLPPLSSPISPDVRTHIQIHPSNTSIRL